MENSSRRLHGILRSFLFTGLACYGAACGQSPHVDTETIGATGEQTLGGYNYSNNVAWSQNPPGGLSVSQVPQFLQLGFDDNPRSGIGTTPASGMTWILNFLRNKRNPAGSGNAATFDNALVRASFYSNSTYIAEGFVENPTNVKESWRTAIIDGHETGVHTHTHPDLGAATEATVNAEIDTNVDWLTRPYVANAAPGPGSGPGATNASIEGFRAPFLSYNVGVFNQLKVNGFTYDISVEEGWQLSDAGTNFNWPYTLNNGSPGGTFVGRPTGNQTGLWELGAAPFVKPPTQGGGKVTGLDYNVFISAGMTKAQALDTFKYTLDQRLLSNRAPFFFGLHTNIYTDSVSAPGTTPQERREVIEEFVNYALTKSAVRIVTAKNVITWMRNPVALGGGCTPETDAQFCSRLGKNCGTVSGTDNCGSARTVNSCGSCTSPQTCGGGGTANICGSTTNGDKTEGGTATGPGTACNTTTETVAKAYDNLMTSANFSKWCVNSGPSPSAPVSTVYDFAGSTAFAINQYTVTSANDNPTRDPKDWTLQGCQASCTAGSDTGWTTLDTRTGQFVGAARFLTNSYTFTNATAYQQYRLRVTANNGAVGKLQIAEIQMFAGTACTPETNAAFCARLGKNCGSVTANDNCGVSRTVSSCGTCTTPQTCGGGGVANVCGGGGSPTCAPAYAQGNCLNYVMGTVVSSGGHNWLCSNGNCANCASFASCAPGGTGCPWGVVWTDNGLCQ